MKDWRQIAVSPKTLIRNVLAIIDQAALQIALVVDEDDKLMGTVTDGDVRRGILRGVGLDESVRRVFNQNPVTVSVDDDLKHIYRIMRERRARRIPVLDHDGRVVRLELLQEFLDGGKQDSPVLLMAGGLGTRLKPLTDDCPKPLLKVGGKPVLETILDNFIEYGFWKFYISVNYKAKMIEEHFGDGSRWGVHIDYVHEEERLGTAGALGLLPERPKHTLLVMNGDLITKVNFNHLLEFHREQNVQATMCAGQYDFQVPYGVAEVRDNRLAALNEKPVQSFFVNAGIYLLEPDVLDLVPRGSFCDMTDLLSELLEKGREAAVFPLREYWLDIGRLSDLKRANGEYGEWFK